MVLFPAAETAQITSVKSELGKFPTAAGELRREASRHMKTASQILELLDEKESSLTKCAAIIDQMKSMLRTGR